MGLYPCLSGIHHRYTNNGTIRGDDQKLPGGVGGWAIIAQPTRVIQPATLDKIRERVYTIH